MFKNDLEVGAETALALSSHQVCRSVHQGLAVLDLKAELSTLGR